MNNNLTYACLIISSTGVWAAYKGLICDPVSEVECWLCCLTDEIKLKKKGMKVPQPPSLNKILNEWVEYRDLLSFSGTTWKHMPRRSGFTKKKKGGHGQQLKAQYCPAYWCDKSRNIFAKENWLIEFFSMDIKLQNKAIEQNKQCKLQRPVDGQLNEHKVLIQAILNIITWSSML